MGLIVIHSLLLKLTELYTYIICIHERKRGVDFRLRDSAFVHTLIVTEIKETREPKASITDGHNQV